MTKATFNAENWTGKTCTISIRKDGSFIFNGETIAITAHPESGTVEGLTMMEIKENGRKIGTLAKWEGEATWSATSDFGSLSRSDENPQVAAAKLLSNI